jgi:hypothetical protein
VNTINVSAVVSGGVVADFSDPSGILAGKTINLDLSAPNGMGAGQDGRINYSVISMIENAFKTKGAAAVLSDTGPAIPVFDVSRGNDSISALIDSKGITAQNPEVKIVNGITARYKSGNKILEVSATCNYPEAYIVVNLPYCRSKQYHICGRNFNAYRIWR